MTTQATPVSVTVTLLQVPGDSWASDTVIGGQRYRITALTIGSTTITDDDPDDYARWQAFKRALAAAAQTALGGP